jgi:hypothetical protein
MRTKSNTRLVILLHALDEGGFCAIVVERAPRPARQSIATMIAALRGFAAWAPALVL